MGARERVGLRKKTLKVSQPARWVFTCPEAANGGRIKDFLDAAPQTPSGLGEFLPNRLQHLQDRLGVDLIDRDSANLGAVGGEGQNPLCNVLIVAPALAVGLDVGIGAVAEARDSALGLNARLTCLQRVDARCKSGSRLSRQFPRPR